MSVERVTIIPRGTRLVPPSFFQRFVMNKNGSRDSHARGHVLLAGACVYKSHTTCCFSNGTGPRCRVRPRTTQGMILQHMEGDQTSRTRTQFIAMLDIAMAGRAAEELMCELRSFLHITSENSACPPSYFRK
jgi:hypothetical protein